MPIISNFQTIPTTVDVIYINSGAITLSDYKTAGIYYFGTGCTLNDAPVGTNGWLIVLQSNISDTTITKQLWMRHGTATTNSFMTYERLINGSTVGEWRRFLTGGDSITLLTGTLPAANGGTGRTDGATPISHAATKTTYGAGDASNYGHVKLSDAKDSTNGVSDGIAATPSAVKAAYDLAADTRQRITNSNLVINWYLIDPIDQKGLGSYSGAGYLVDRWFATNSRGIYTVTDEGLKIETNGSGASYIRQVIPITLEPGTKITVSALVKGTASGKLSANHVEKNTKTELYSASGATFSPSETWTLVTKTYSIGSAYGDAHQQVIISNEGNGEVYVKAVKFELGSIQTLAHEENGEWILNDPLPNPDSELAECQKYFYRISFKNTYDMVPASGFIGSSIDSVRVAITTPVPMRTTPTASINGSIYLLSSTNPNTYTENNLISGIKWVSVNGNSNRQT